MIAGVMQTVGGQVAQVSELFSLEYENGSSTERGLYVYNGFMIHVTRHHKAKRSTNREFNVVRFLCGRGGQVVFKYLVYMHCSKSPTLTVRSQDVIKIQDSGFSIF
jgi:hypothetical protein